MPKRAAYVPKHRQAPPPSALTVAPKRVISNTVVFSSLAVAATGATISGGVLVSAQTTTVAASSTTAGDVAVAQEATATQNHRRTGTASRSADRRAAADPAKQALLQTAAGPAVVRTEDLSQADPRAIARALLGDFGFGPEQFGCLDTLYMGESGWRVDADNPTSSAYGIPQALPGYKMASAGADWATNPVTQIRWGLGYIRDRYGSPCGAMSFKSGHGWY